MSQPRRVEASAPSRIDLAGGTLDIWPISVLVPGALTVNLALELRATVTIERLPERRVVVESRDRRRRVTRKLPLRASDVKGPLALLVRLVKAFEPDRGLRMVTEARAPAGAGLGGSSTLGIAVGSALNRWTSAGLGRQRLLGRVMNLEAMQLGAPTGNQDYLAAIHGGMRVLALSVVTDMCFPDHLEPASIPQILEVAGRTAPVLDELVTGVIGRLGEAS